ncbi:unnamed protein product, partial [Ectocarpus sp. 12 AP-2014]
MMFRVPSDNFASCWLADFHWCQTIAKARTVPSYVAQPNPDIARPYANLALLIYQETNSLLTITEIDPLDFAELFGTVGGFWGEDAGRIIFAFWRVARCKIDRPAGETKREWR